jgi:hypothetical protein
VLPTVAALLLGPVFSLVLRLLGRIVLHGSAVAIDGRVLVLLGSKAAGKTTTALTLLQRGAALVTDDLVALHESPSGFLVPPGPPSLRLLPDSAQILGGSYDELRLLGTEDMPLRKRCLDVGEGKRVTTSLPLDRMYLLGTRTLAGPVCSITNLGPAESLATLMAHRMCKPFLTQEGHARDMQELSRLCSEVPVRLLTRREGLKGLDLIARTLLDADSAPVADGEPSGLPK